MAWRNVRLIVVGFIFFLCAPVQAQQENEGTAPNADVSKLYGEGEPNVATALTNLAEQYKAQGRYADAEPLYQRSLAIREKGLGPDHPDVATALNNLADLYLSQGRYADAEPLYERAVAIYEKALGPDQPDAKAAAVAAAAPTSAPDSPENDSVAVDKKEETAAPTNAATPEEPAPLPTGGQATTEYYGGAEPPTTPAWAAKATMNPDYKTEETLAPEAAAAAEEPAPPPTGGQATTEYYGGTESPTNPAWAAEATMNPDYKNEETAPPTTAAATEEPAPPPTGEEATTEYYGGAESPTNPAWAAEATMNPDYKTEETLAPEAAAAAEEPAPPPTGGQATTEYYGGTESPTNPAWAAEATMNPEHAKRTPPAESSSTTSTSPASAPVQAAAVEACRDALSTETRAAKVYFANSSFNIEPGSQGTLGKIAAIVKNCGNVVVEVGGHTDNTGAPDFNKTLSQLRAKAAVDFLIVEGVDPAKLKAVGYGQEKPITTNDTAEGRNLNRCIEFLVSNR